MFGLLILIRNAYQIELNGTGGLGGEVLSDFENLTELCRGEATLFGKTSLQF